MELKQGRSGSHIDYMARDYDSLLDAMYRQIPERLPEWTDYRQPNDFGNVLLQLFAHMGDILSYYQDRIVNESFLSVARERRSIIQHLRLIGYQLATASPASARLDIAIPAAVNDAILLRRGDAFATRSTREQAAVRFEFNGADLSIDCSALQVAADGFKHVEVDVEEGRLVREDLLGISDGSANQRFALTHAGLVLRGNAAVSNTPRDIELWLEQGGTLDRDWALQESLAFSRENQKDYCIDVDENDVATVLFGSGQFGAIPPTGAQVKARYRVGGGLLGNVASKAINTIADAPALNLVGATVNNISAATGGAERESIEHAVLHGPYVFRSLRRAVTADDYRELALRFNGVERVRAQARNWNQVVLHISPSGGGRVSDVLRANLLAYFEDKRPLSTVIEIEDVDYVRIYLSATVGLHSYYSQSELRKQIELAVSTLLSSQHTDFGRPLYLSKFYEAIESIEGVAYVTLSEFRREDGLQAVQPEGRIELAVSELPRLPGIEPSDPASDLPYVSGLRIISFEGGF